MQKQMGERAGALACHTFPERPHENGHLQCRLETEGLRRSIQNLGVLITTSAVGHTSVATGEGLRHAVIGQHSTITVTTKDKDGELVRSGNALLKADITGPEGSKAVEAEVVDNKNGTYEVGYTLRSEGEYSFSLMLYGQPVRGSPFRLRGVKPSDVPQSPEDVKRRVKSPSGSGGHIRQKAVRRPSSMYSTTKKKENPIEDELIYRVGKPTEVQWIVSPGVCFIYFKLSLCHVVIISACVYVVFTSSSLSEELIRNWSAVDSDFWTLLHF